MAFATTTSNFWSHHLGDFFFFVVATLIVARAVVWNFLKGLWASSWTATQGRVEFGSVEERHARYFTYYVARLDYSYSVSDEYYSGYLEKVFIRESSADRFLDKMKGQMVIVRSNPHRPERSALLTEDQLGGWAT